MSKTQTSSGQAVAEVPNGFTDLRFESPQITLVQQLLGRFVVHKGECGGGEACICGLKEAVADLVGRENIVQRYGR